MGNSRRPKPPPPPRRGSGELAAVRGHVEAARAELTPTPAAGTAIPGAGVRAEAFRLLMEAERTGNLQMGFRACRTLFEQLLGRDR